MNRLKEIIAFQDLLENRTFEKWKDQWGNYDINHVKMITDIIINGMGWKALYLYPQDSLRLLLLNRTSDMREIDVLISLEKYLNINLEDYSQLKLINLLQKRTTNKL